MAEKLLVVDIETDYDPYVHFANSRTGIVCIGVHSNEHQRVFNRDDGIDFLKTVPSHYRIVGHNLKFDLCFLLPHCPNLSRNRVYDTQTAEYILEDQKVAWVSLNQLAEKYLGESKIDVVKEEYWDKGIATADIPVEVLYEYCAKDCELTYNIALYQLARLPQTKHMLMNLAMQDYKIACEMELNGIRFNTTRARERATECEAELATLFRDLSSDIHFPDFNFNSPVHLSALLYGGTLSYVTKEVNGVFKTGKNAGETKYKNVTKEVKFPRQYKPLKGSETARKGVWSTDEETLKKIGAGDLVGKLLRIRKLEKLLGTYYRGIPQQIENYNWTENKVHGQFNTAVTETGRWSSSKPNLQNIAGEVKDLIETRFAD